MLMFTVTIRMNNILTIFVLTCYNFTANCSNYYNKNDDIKGRADTDLQGRSPWGIQDIRQLI